MSLPDDDPDIVALKRANRRPYFIALGVAGLVVLWVLVKLVTGKAEVRSSLEEQGFTDVELHMNGVFDYGFTAKKGDSTCGGSVTKLPFSSSQQFSCFSAK